MTVSNKVKKIEDYNMDDESQRQYWNMLCNPSDFDSCKLDMTNVDPLAIDPSTPPAVHKDDQTNFNYNNSDGSNNYIDYDHGSIDFSSPYTIAGILAVIISALIIIIALALDPLTKNVEMQDLLITGIICTGVLSLIVWGVFSVIIWIVRSAKN